MSCKKDCSKECKECPKKDCKKSYKRKSRCESKELGCRASIEGMCTIASGDFSHAEGCFTVACGKCSHAEGCKSKAKGQNAHAEGCLTTAKGCCSHSEGKNTTSRGESSHAEGCGSESKGKCSHAEGCGSESTGDCSHAEGCGTEAYGDCAHAEGKQTRASGKNSSAKGFCTIADGESSYASGVESKARLCAQMAHAAGNFYEKGDAQCCRYVLKNTTVGGTVSKFLVICDDEKLIVPTQTTWCFEISVVGRRIGNVPDKQCRDNCWKIAGLVQRTDTLVDPFTLTVFSGVGAGLVDSCPWIVDVIKGDAFNLVIKVTGVSAATIRWVACVNTNEVSGNRVLLQPVY